MGTKYFDSDGAPITEAAFMVGKAARATEQAATARTELESAQLEESDYIEAEYQVEHLERQAAFYTERNEILNGATSAAKKKPAAKKKTGAKK